MDIFLTPDWFSKHAVLGIAIGYGLRVFEHFIWSTGQNEDTSIGRFALQILPQSVVMGVALGYLSLIIFAYLVKNDAAIQFAAYLLTSLMAFLAGDFRDFLRRPRS
jgi:hypothetical protein